MIDARASWHAEGMHKLALVVLPALVLVSLPAAATTETGTDTGTSTDTGTDTTGDPTTDSTSDTSDSSGDCGSCDSETPPMITSPADGAMVDSPFTLEFSLGVACSCDDCGCYADSAWGYRVVVDGIEMQGNDMPGSSTELALAPGVHEIVVYAEYSFHAVASNQITVTVGESEDGASAEGSGEGSGEGGSEGGKGCSASEPSPSWFALLGLVALVGVARRRSAS